MEPVLAETPLAQLGALTERGLIQELARTEDALRADRLARAREHHREPPGAERLGLLSHQQRVLAELQRRRATRGVW